MYKCFKKTGNTGDISEQKFNELSDEIIKPSTISNNSLAPLLYYVGAKVLTFNGIYLKQDEVTFNNGTKVNICIVYELSPILNNFEFALENCFFEAIKLTKNADIDKYKHSGYGIRFDAKGSFFIY